MGEVAESILVKKCHDNDAFDISRITYERVNGDTLVKISEDINVGITNAQNGILDEEKKHKHVIEDLNKQLKILEKRKEVFTEAVERHKLKPKVEEVKPADEHIS